jgi:small-conductance mechanosensitive channel
MLIAAEKPLLDPGSHWVAAVVIVIVTLVLARLVNSLMLRSAKRLDSREGRNEPLSQSTVTRLRLLRRLVVVFIILIGSFIALSQFEEFRTLSAALLASSAIFGVAIGWASRAVLANAIAGMMLASVQPFRIGDEIEWQEKRGLVEDITLTYTFLRMPTGNRLLIPNELIATSPVENCSVVRRPTDAPAYEEATPEGDAGILD